MSDSYQYAQTTVDRTYTELQPHMVALVQRLALTYLIPMLLAVIVATVGGRILPQFVPLSTATLLLLVANVLLLYYSWRFAESRFRGTALFILYAAFSRERRELKRLLAQTPPPDGMTLRERADALSQSAQTLAQAVEMKR